MSEGTYREPTEAEIAWAAGLFDGEGCITRSHRLNAEGKDTGYWRLALAMADEDVVRRFREVVGSGTIRPMRTQNHRKNMVRFHIGARSEVTRILTMLLPWFGFRRRAKAEEALEELHERAA